MDIQTALDALESILVRRNRWYEPLEYSREFLARGPKYWYFFPKEIANIVPLDDSQKEEIEKAREWYRDYISEKDDDVVSIYEFSESWPEMKGDAFRIICRKEFLASCVEGWNREGSFQLSEEMKRLGILFTTDEMLEKYIKRTCPLLNSCIERWRLLNKLKESLQEIRQTQPGL